MNSLGFYAVCTIVITVALTVQFAAGELIADCSVDGMTCKDIPLPGGKGQACFQTSAGSVLFIVQNEQPDGTPCCSAEQEYSCDAPRNNQNQFKCECSRVPVWFTAYNGKAGLEDPNVGWNLPG